jgi:hypothetical protein
MSRNQPYMAGSPPDVAARLREALEANDTTRALVEQSVKSFADAINLHLDHQDAHLRRLIADLEGRAKSER